MSFFISMSPISSSVMLQIVALFVFFAASLLAAAAASLGLVEGGGGGANGTIAEPAKLVLTDCDSSFEGGDDCEDETTVDGCIGGEDFAFGVGRNDDGTTHVVCWRGLPTSLPIALVLNSKFDGLSSIRLLLLMMLASARTPPNTLLLFELAL